MSISMPISCGRVRVQVHCVHELVGGEATGRLLTQLGRLFNGYMQMHGHTCGIQDLLLTDQADAMRTRLLANANALGDAGARKFANESSAHDGGGSTNGGGSGRGAAAAMAEHGRAGRVVGVDSACACTYACAWVHPLMCMACAWHVCTGRKALQESIREALCSHGERGGARLDGAMKEKLMPLTSEVMHAWESMSLAMA